MPNSFGVAKTSSPGNGLYAPSARVSPTLGHRKTPACNDCRRRKRRCIHDKYGNLDPLTWSEARYSSDYTFTKRAVPNSLRAREDQLQNSDDDCHPPGLKSEPDALFPLLTMKNWEGFPRPLKALHPEEDFSSKLTFAGQGPFTKLSEPLESFAKYDSSASRETAEGGDRSKTAIVTGPPNDHIMMAIGSLDTAIDLSDDDFSSPKSRRFKLAAKKVLARNDSSAAPTTGSRRRSVVRDTHIVKEFFKPEPIANPMNQEFVKSDDRPMISNIHDRNDSALENSLPLHGEDVISDVLSSHKGMQRVEPECGAVQKQTQTSGRQSVSSQMGLGQVQNSVTNSLSRKLFWPKEYRRSLANAARKALQEDPANCGRTLWTNKIMELLDQTSSYVGLCELLRRQGFKVEFTSFAQQLLAAVPAMQNMGCFNECTLNSEMLNGKYIAVQQDVSEDLIFEPGFGKDPVPSTQDSGNQIQPGEVQDGDVSIPRLVAPVATMITQPPTQRVVPHENPAGSLNVDDEHSVILESQLKLPNHVPGIRDGASAEVADNVLFEMEKMIRLQRQAKDDKEAQQRRNAIVRDEARQFLADSKPGGFRKGSKFQNSNKIGHRSQGVWTHARPNESQLGFTASGPTVMPNFGNVDDVTPHNAHESPPAAVDMLDTGESDLFLSDFGPHEYPQNPPKPGGKRIDFATWSKCDRDPKQVGLKRRRDEPTLLDYFSPNKNPAVIAKARTRFTLENGHFDRHKQRTKALTDYAKQKRNSHRDAFDGQEVDLEEAAEVYNRSNGGHPSTGGKGLSAATMGHWDSATAAQAYNSPSDTESEEDHYGEPEALYEYRVRVREWSEDESEVDARNTELGPFYTMAEANRAAAISIQKPSVENRDAVFRPGAWSYNYSKDDQGMETHTVGFGGGSIAASVSRDVVPPNHETTLPARAFTLPRVVYLVLLQLLPPPASVEDELFGDSSVKTPTNHESMEATNLKACTTLALANKAAGQKWLELQTKDFVSDDLDNLRRARIETSLRKDLRQMEQDNVSFDRTSGEEESGERFHVWVQMVEIDGPRN